MSADLGVAEEKWIRFGRELVLIRSTTPQGPTAGPPVLLINGIGAHTRMWGLMERTLTDRQVVSFDAPGAGRSSTPRGVASVTKLASLTAHVLDEWKVEQADAVGYSMGGIVLQQLLADRPERIRRAVLVGTSPGVGAVYGPALSVLNVTTPLRFLSDRFYLRSIGSLVGGRARTDDRWVTEHLPIRLLHRPSIGGYSRQVLSLATWSGLPLLPGIDHPVLVVAGEDDPLSPVANALLLAHLLAHARVRVMPGEGHLMLLDDQSTVPAMVAEFLGGATAEDTAAWRDSRRVTLPDLEQALAGTGLQLQMGVWGAVSALQRRRWVNRARS